MVTSFIGLANVLLDGLRRAAAVVLHRVQTRATAGMVAVAFTAVGLTSTATFAQTSPASAPATKAATIRAVVTVPALKSIVEPLLPPGSELRVLMQPGRSEHGYEFTPSDLAAVAGADLVVYVGLNLEPRVEQTVAKPVEGRTVICFAKVAGLQRSGQPIPNTPEALGHDHHHEHDASCDHEHDEKWVDQHLWLDPMLMAKLVGPVRGAIEETLQAKSQLTTEEQQRQGAAQAALLARIQGVDDQWKASVKSFKHTTIVTHHAAFSRLADRYGLTIVSVIRTIEGSEPTPGDLAKVLEAIEKHKVRAIFVEPQFNPKAAERLARQAKIGVGQLDPMGDGDWFALMQRNLDSLATHLKGE